MAYASRQSSYLLGSIGASLEVFAGWWDVYSHLIFGTVDPWWNPAHLTLYLGLGIVLVAVWTGLRGSRSQPSLVSPIRFVNTAGLKLAGVGSLMQIVAGIWNEMVHLILRQEPKIAPAHALLTLGMLTVALGMVVGLSIEYGMVRQQFIVVSSLRKRAVVGCTVLAFASIWLASAGALIYVARVFRGEPSSWIVAALLSVFVTLILVPAKKVLPWFGSATLIGVVFNGVAYFFLVAFADVPVYVPWGLVPVLVFDILMAFLKQRGMFTKAIVLPSTLMGLLFYATYYPFSLDLFPSSVTIRGGVVVLAVASIVGGLLGNQTHSAVSSLVLRDAL